MASCYSVCQGLFLSNEHECQWNSHQWLLPCWNAALKRLEFHRQLRPLVCKCLDFSRSSNLFSCLPSSLFLTLHLCHSLSLFYVTFVSCSTHTHTFRHTHTLLRLSCGNRPCPCKSWLRVINQASQPSSTFVWFDWTATVCHRKRPKALRVYMSYIYKYACITILLFDRKPKQQQCCLTFQCFSPFCKWDVFDFC